MSCTDHLSELEALRLQVGELTRALAERDQSLNAERHQLEETIRNFREQSHRLRVIVEGTAAETGDEFFTSLVRYLTSTLHVQYALIGEVSEGPSKKIRTIAVSAGGALVDNFEYEIAHTPCAAALTQTFACFDRDVQATFPQFKRLADLGAESYCGVPLRTKGGAVVGLLVVMDTKPLQQGDDLRSLLRVLAPRVAAEFERKRAEQERTQALADIHNVVETVPDIMFTLDTQGNMVKWNRRVVDVTGYSPEELLNMPALAFVPPEEQTRTASAIQRAYTEGYAELEGHLLTKDHRLIPYHWTGALLKSLHGEPIGITGIGRDVSDEKRAEAVLRESEERLALAVEGSTDILWDAHRLPGEPWHAPQTPIWWSPRVRHLLGLQESDSFETFEQWAVRLHPDDKDRVFSQLAAHIEHRAPYDVEYRLRHNRGDYLWIHGRGQAQWDEQGEPRRMSGSCQDITERKRLDEALRASEERWQLAVRGSNDGSRDWDIQSGTVFFSPRWKAMRGFGEHEITNHVEEWQSRIHPADLGRVRLSLDAYLARQTPEFCEEYRTQRKDGSYMWILDRGLVLWADDGMPLRMVGLESDITEHKQALFRLAEQESLLRAILDTEPECVNRVADDGTILQMNRAGLCFIESDSFEQVAGRLVYDLVAPEFLEQYRRMHEAVIRGATQQFEFQIVGLKGTRRWVETHAVPLRNPVDHRMEHLAITRDITERKRAEEALRASEERFHVAFRHATVGMGLIDLTNRIVEANQAFSDITGYSEAELKNLTFLDITHPDDRPANSALQQNAVKGRRDGFEVEKRYIRKNGEIVWVHVSVGAIHDVLGQVTHTIGLITDITERKQSEEALRKSEAQFRALAESTTDWMWEIDAQGRYTYCSPKIRDFLGYEPDEALGKTPFDFMPEDEARRVAGLFGPIAAAREPFAGIENTNRRKDGQIVILECRGTPIIDDNGVFGGYRGFDQDITERKQADEALIRSERQLRTVLDALPVGVWFTDQSGRPVLSNPAAKQIWSNIKQVGVETTDDNSGWWEAVGSSDAFHRWALSQSLTKGIPSLNDTLDLECLDGSIKTIRNTTVPVQDPDGDILGAIVLNEDMTMLRRMQGALKLTQSSVDHAVEGFLWIDSDARILNVNDATCRMLEYTRDELTTMTLHDIDPNFPQELWPVHWEELKRKGSMTFESKHWSKTGRVLDTEVTVTCLDYEGRKYGSAIMRDIGERKRAEEALRASETRFRAIFDQTFQFIGLMETDGTLIEVNRSALQFAGIKEQDVLGKLFWDTPWWTHSPDLQDQLREAVRQAAGGAMVRFEATHPHPTGELAHVDFSLKPVRDEHGNVILLIPEGRDITERKQVEEELRKSHAFIRQVIDTDPNFIFAKDREGRFTMANKAVADVYGTSVENLIGKTDADFNANQEEVESFRQGDLNVLDSLQDLFIPEEIITDPTGRTRWLQTVKRPILDERGRAIMMLGTATDITERKRMEETLRQQERDLRAALEERERISQDLHDGILQSLFAVGLALETAKSMMSPKTRQTSGPPLDQAITQLNLVMQEIRDFIAGLGSDLLHGKDLSMALEHMLTLLTQNRATRVRLAVEDRAAKALSAQQSLHLLRVIQEAVSNCIRHGRAQEATVSLKMLKQGVRLSIRDNGSGFNPRVARQTGHGLTNMAARARKMGGRFSVVSKLNEGTRVVVDLPNEAALASH